MEDARDAVQAGCDALGFLFYKKSPRYISPQKACRIIRALPKNIIKVGVFVNAKGNYVKDIAKLCRLDILQFHGEESCEFCKRFKGYKIIKTFRVKDRIDLAKIHRYKTFAYLFDTFSRARMGGTGKTFDWNLLCDIKHPVFLAGGLNSKNVAQAIKLACPEWVDASSSLEAKPGKKDRQKVREFVKTAKRAAL